MVGIRIELSEKSSTGSGNNCAQMPKRRSFKDHTLLPLTKTTTELNVSVPIKTTSVS